MVSKLIPSLSLLLLSIAHTSEVSAGAPFATTAKLRILEVIHCETLTLDNIGKVRSFYAYPNGKIPEGEIPENALKNDPGFVIDAKILRARDITYPNPMFSNAGAKPRATSWKEFANPEVSTFYLPKRQGVNCEELTRKTRINVTVGEESSSCGAAYCDGSQMFKSRIWIISPEQWQRYENVQLAPPTVTVDGKRFTLGEEGKLNASLDRGKPAK